MRTRIQDVISWAIEAHQCELDAALYPERREPLLFQAETYRGLLQSQTIAIATGSARLRKLLDGD